MLSSHAIGGNGATEGKNLPERRERKSPMTATQVLLTAAMGVVVGVIGGFDIGYALGFDAGSRRRAGEGRPE